MLSLDIRFRARLALCAALLCVTAAVQASSSPAAATHAQQPFEEALIRVTATSAAEDQALQRALDAYRQRRDAAALRRYAAAHPANGWNLALLTNLGLIDYQHGRFGEAIAAWQSAWTLGKGHTQPAAKALADRAVGELLRMHARLGHADELSMLLKEIEGRALVGPAAEAASGARHALWKMQNEPGVAYLCGPMALRSVLLRGGAQQTEQLARVEAYRSSPRGVSLAEVGALATSAQMDLVPVRRIGDAPLPVPAVVHWKLDHYAAIVEQRDGLYKLEDPTFGHPLWIAKADLLAEASGYFLIPRDARDGSAWRDVTPAEAATVYGRGIVAGQDGDGNGPASDGDPGCGTCRYSIDLLTAGLKLNDRPVGYRPPVGPLVMLQLSYNQREAYQPAVANFGNYGPQWTSNWLSYVTDDPAVAGVRVSWTRAGGGGFKFTGWEPASGKLKPAYPKDGSELVRIPVAPVTYERRLSDGGREIYAHSDGATAYPRRIFLTHIVDPQGNALRLEYDAQRRLTGVVDAIGQRTTLSYGLAASPYLVTRVTDPFGRKAQLQYDASGRLIRITDAVGLKSQFTYDGAGGFVNSLKTAYGTTSFVYGEAGVQRWLDATDPQGHTERVEFRPQAPGIAVNEPVAPSGMTVVNNHLWYRNSFHWDKHAYALAAGDYTKANITHWFHSNQNFNVASSSIESTKKPLEARVWYSTPGTSNNLASGTLDMPADTGRVLDDGTTQLTKTRYNAKGNVVSVTDAVGRTTEIEYAPNGIDATRVKQWTAGGLAAISQRSYNAQHRPISVTDAAGQTSTFTYNAAGQLLTETDPLGRIWRYEYTSKGQLRRILNPDGSTAESYTYDAVGRIASRTDSEGHTVQLAYDKLDRPLRLTYPDGTSESTTWNKLDVGSTTDRLGRTTQYTYDKNRNPIKRTDPLGRVTQAAYFPNGLLQSLTDARGKTTRWERDIQGRVTAKIYHGGSRVDFAYENTTSRLKTRTDALGQSRSYGYARDDRVTSVSYAGAVNPTPNATYTYDTHFPRLTQMQNGSGATSFAYGALGAPGALQLVQEDGPYANDTLSWGYDAAGRVASRTVGGAVESFGYDLLDRIATQSNALGTITRNFLGASDLTTATQVAGSPVATLYEYESVQNDRRLKRIVNHGAARSHALTTDAAYRVLGIDESVGGGTLPTVSRSYSYDAADRLQGATGSDGSAYAYSYDAADNILQQSINGVVKSAQVNSLNQVVKFDGLTLLYDANGNRIEDADAHYDWDAEDRLVRVRRKAPAGHSLEMQYDGFGRRHALQLVAPSQTQSLRLLWCEQNLPCQLRDGSDAVLKRYYDHGEFDVATGARRWYAHDQIGSVRDLIDLAAGTVTAARDYTPYGGASGAGNEPGFGFAGLYAVGSNYPLLATYRAYAPTQTNWLSRDPMEEGGGLNLYGYAGSNPLIYVDPEGLQPYGGATPPPSIPGGPYKWSPDRGGPNSNPNSRTGTFTGQGSNNVNWDRESSHWDHNDGRGNRTRYDRHGNMIDPNDPHGYQRMRKPRHPPFRMPFMLCPMCSMVLPPCDPNSA